jgi:prophage regulatory protein
MRNSGDRVNETAIPDEVRFIKLREVLTICGKSRSSVYAAIRRGNFPAPVKLGQRSSAWIKSEVLQWAQACIDSSRQDTNIREPDLGRASAAHAP